MRLTLDPSEGRPVYRQIADELEREIGVGILRAGDALPAVRGLAAELRVNPNTVLQAYRWLATQGRVEVRRGRGTFVIGQVRAKTPAQAARVIATRALRDAYRQGLLASDLVQAIGELAPEGQVRTVRSR